MIAELRTRIDAVVWGDVLLKHGLPGRVAGTILRYLYALVRDILSGQLTLRSMSLVYTTLLSIVPLIALSFSVLKGLGVHNDLRPILEEFLVPLGDQGLQISSELFGLVENVRGGVLGGVSLAFFIFTAISMVQKVEESFNYVWHVAQPRSLARRVSEYTVVLLIGPVAIVVALGMIASIQSNSLVQWLLQNESFGSAIVMLGTTVPYLLVIGVFTFLYMFVPNTSVRFKSALLGGVAGGVMWASMSAVFATFVVYAGTRQLIYSGFAVAITALIWLYLNWLVLLLGAQLAFYHQRPAFLRIGQREPRLSNAMRERLAINIMYLVGKAFRDRDARMTLEVLGEQLKIPVIAMSQVVSRLVDSGLLVATEKGKLMPGADISRMLIADIVQCVREFGDTGSYRGPLWTPGVDALGRKFDDAVAGVMGDMSLADLIDQIAAEA
ncbi:MAG: YihY/virulence factor BrkB family protein [Woeseia sp.]